MGILALSGVVVNDSLIMINYANRRRAGQSALDAIYQAGLRRFRPIILVIVPCLYMVLEDLVRVSVGEKAET